MSGQPNRYANSAEIFRNQYMDALNSRANVDEFNLQANKNYKATGTLPPNVKAMVDNRTTTEILADSEKLKLNIISELKPVMNSGTASVVVQKIQTAPLNADGSFLVWTAQNIPEIVKSLKKKYALGIKGDAQDATNIVIFLSDMYSKIKDYSGTVKSYFDTVGDSKAGLKEGDLDALRKEYEVIVARIKSKYPNFRGERKGEFEFNKLILNTSNKIQSLFFLLSSDRYKQLISDFNDVSQTDLLAVNGRVDTMKNVLNLLDELPSVSNVRALYRQLDTALENKNSTLSYEILNKINELFPSLDKLTNVSRAVEEAVPSSDNDYSPNVYTDDVDITSLTENIDDYDYRERLKNLFTSRTLPLESIKQLKQQFLNDIYSLNRENSVITQEIKDLQLRLDDPKINRPMQIKLRKSLTSKNERKAEIETLLTVKKGRYDYINSSEKEFTEKIKPSLSEEVYRVSEPSQYTPAPPVSVNTFNEISKIKSDIEKLTKEYNDTANAKDNLYQNIGYDTRGNELKAGTSVYVAMIQQLTPYNDKLKELENQIYELNEQKSQLEGINPSGSGLKKRRGRPKGSGISFKDNIDHAKGIQPVKKYHPFGKYFVNSHKLNNGSVLSIKSKSGTNVREYPSKTVSRNLGHVIKTIVGGGVPSWNDMEKLTNDEKDYLYKISKRAEFADKITIPTPSKDQQEKDIHEFDVCKGEIMAGNDSKELIKKFKLLIIKLSKNGSIPKREASEVMQELLELGY
jgi:hypothetical protein